MYRMGEELDEPYYGPMTNRRSRGEQAEERYGDLDSLGAPDYGDRRDDPGQGMGGAAVASDRRHAGRGGSDVPTAQVSANATDQDTDEAATLRDPDPPPQDGADAPLVDVAVPHTWGQLERSRRRPHTHYGRVHGEATGDESPPPSYEIAVGPRGSLPDPDDRTTGYVGADGARASIGGRSRTTLDHAGAKPFPGFVIDGAIGGDDMVGSPAKPTPDEQGRLHALMAGRRGVKYRDPIHQAADGIRRLIKEFIGDPVEVPSEPRPS